MTKEKIIKYINDNIISNDKDIMLFECNNNDCDYKKCIIITNNADKNFPPDFTTCPEAESYYGQVEFKIIK